MNKAGPGKARQQGVAESTTDALRDWLVLLQWGLWSGQGHRATAGGWAEAAAEQTNGSAAGGGAQEEMQRRGLRVPSFISL